MKKGENSIWLKIGVFYYNESSFLEDFKFNHGRQKVHKIIQRPPIRVEKEWKINITENRRFLLQWISKGALEDAKFNYERVKVQKIV